MREIQEQDYRIKEYQIPKRATRGTLDVCLSLENKLDACIDVITSNGYTVGTARQFAEARIAEWKASGVTYGPLNAESVWVAEDVVYLPKRRFNADVLFVPKWLNPFLRYTKQATQAQREGKALSITDEHVEQIAGAKGVLRLARKKLSSSINVDAIGRESVTEFLGWDSEYGKLLKSICIKDIPLCLVNADFAGKQKQAFCFPVLVAGLYGGSAIIPATAGFLGYNARSVFGVRELSEATDMRPRR